MPADIRRLPSILSNLSVPLIAAPMLTVSGPDLVIAACRAGIVGAFPALNARSIAELGQWLDSIVSASSQTEGHGPVCVNLVMRSPRIEDEVACLIDRGIGLVITSVGSPRAVLPRLRAAGVTVLADVGSLDHARKAIEAGVDGLVLLTAGAGGQTGWLNPLAFVRAVRAFYDGPVVMAGGISDGVALRAATVLGCDLGYMGTRFIATHESMAADGYRRMLVESSIDDIIPSRAFTGLTGNYLTRSILAAGLDPRNLDETVSAAKAAAEHGSGGAGPRRWSQIWSAGHSVSGVGSVQTVAEVVETTRREYRAAIGAQPIDNHDGRV